MMPLSILLAVVFFGTGNSSSKIVQRAFPANSRLDAIDVQAKYIKALSRYFGMTFLWLEMQ